MIEEINRLLSTSGSRFRTDDGLTLSMYCGQLVFLRKSFESQQECLEYVLHSTEGVTGR